MYSLKVILSPYNVLRTDEPVVIKGELFKTFAFINTT